ncbi:unnamed protein product [Dibothriocephalus latus]|uniref:Uncharacterized protein n=1 Tax=Dibothriocephalus latus TaxID=60516 RepID=A0A3P7KVW6_DIBLA|nr:unnamed protein product [Dibothriocephalus latus]
MRKKGVAFEDYVQTISNKRFKASWTKLLRIFQPIKAPKTLLNNPQQGPKFCIPRKKPKQLESETESKSFVIQTADLKYTKPREIDYLKSTLVNCCQQYLRKAATNKDPLTKAHLDSLMEVRRNENIVLARPDEGSGIVLMNKNDYVAKLEAIPADRTKFSKSESDKDRTEAVEGHVTKILKDLHKDGLLSDKELER